MLCKAGCATLMAVASLAAAGKPAAETWSLAAFGMYPAWEVPNERYDVRGMRFNLIAGCHRNVTGVDFGTLVNICDGSCSGAEFAGICNVVGDSAWAVQIAAACNYSHHDAYGLQLALINWGDEDMAGLQLGGFNCAGMFGGCQIGVLNSAESGGGAQIGVVNVSDEFIGVQFGLINLNLSSGVPVLPIMNVWF